ncbi:MAG: hypothetical protein MUE51_03975 [Thermoleophilia bacterium]|nr:hypothetical protein [Thermoleophilia bacterium]
MRAPALLLPAAALGALGLTVAAAVAGPAPERTPDGLPVCPPAVHDRYATTGADGRRWPTWHPPVDPVHRCAFGHEHGADPRGFPAARWAGMPAFGELAAAGGAEEPHAGFKVFVVADDRLGKAWMVLLHQGTGSARRASVRHHTLEVWMARRTGRTPLARVRAMADFGPAVPNCPGARVRLSMRLLPAAGCESVYESWNTDLRVGRFGARGIAFDVDNATTRVDFSDPGRLVFNRAACGPGDPAGWASHCKGDKRAVIHPRWHITPRGPAVVYTDPRGRGARPAPGPGRAVRQWVRAGVAVDEREACCGNGVVFTLPRPGAGPLRPGTGRGSANVETRTAVRWPN